MRFFFLIAVLLLVACTPGEPPPETSPIAPAATETSPATAVPSETSVPSATETATPAATATWTPVPTNTAVAIQTTTPSPEPSSAPAGPLTFTDGTDGDVFTAKDVLLNSHPETLNRNTGRHRNFELSTTQNSLLQFDLSSLPAGARVIRAALYLTNSYGSGGGSPLSTVHALTAANGGWQEGNGDIDPAKEGESTWNAQNADASGGIGVPWAGDAAGDGGPDAGASVPGVDYDAQPLGQLTWNPNDPLGTVYEIALDPQQVQRWVGPENQNYGVIIVTRGGGGHVGQSDHEEAGYRPRLVVVYEVGE